MTETNEDPQTTAGPADSPRLPTGPGGPLARTTVVYSCDFGDIGWSPSDTPLSEEENIDRVQLHGGYLFANAEMTRRLNEALIDAPDTAQLSPELTYTFSEKRDDLADLVAAMVLIRPGRGVLNDAGWSLLRDAAGAVVDTEDDLPEGAAR